MNPIIPTFIFIAIASIMISCLWLNDKLLDREAILILNGKKKPWGEK